MDRSRGIDGEVVDPTDDTDRTYMIGVVMGHYCTLDVSTVEGDALGLERLGDGADGDTCVYQ